MERTKEENDVKINTNIWNKLNQKSERRKIYKNSARRCRWEFEPRFEWRQKEAFANNAARYLIILVEINLVVNYYGAAAPFLGLVDSPMMAPCRGGD